MIRETQGPGRLRPHGVRVLHQRVRAWQPLQHSPTLLVDGLTVEECTSLLSEIPRVKQNCPINPVPFSDQFLLSERQEDENREPPEP